MNKRDWNNLGGDLNRIIEDAVHNGRYSRLNNEIKETIRSAFGISDFTSNTIPKWDFNLSGQEANVKNEQNKRSTTTTNTTNTNIVEPALYMSKKQRQRGNIIILIVGIFLATIVSLVVLYGFAAIFAGSMMGIFASLIASAIPLIAGVVFITKSTKKHNRSKRFERYLREIGRNEYADISKLAASCNMTEKKALKDIKIMITSGWFIQGRLDKNETCLITSDRAYGQYMESYNNSRRQETERRKAEEEYIKKRNRLSPEVKDILDRGERYIEAIRQSNEAIPGEDVSEKIDKIEDVVRKIFKQTEAHPENAPDLRKFLDYYLPMTIKLLKAYEEMDSHFIEGENIANSKREIEDTLDTLNIAFEKILDDLFEDTAWDVSSDISVLNTILAQEGLTEDGLKNK